MTAPIKTSTKSPADIFLAIGSKDIAKLEANFLNNRPIITGTVTIKNISLAISIKENSLDMLVPINKFNDVKTINGIVITQSKLTIAVNEIESATSPFAK